MDRLHLVDSLMEQRKEGRERGGKGSMARLFFLVSWKFWIRESPNRPELKERPTYFSLGFRLPVKATLYIVDASNVKN